MTPEHILKQIGLTDFQLRRYLRKLTRLYHSFTPAERRVFRAGMHSQLNDASKSFRGKITAKQLEEFIRSREPEGAQTLIIVRKCSDDHHENYEDTKTKKY